MEAQYIFLGVALAAALVTSPLIYILLIEPKEPR